MTPTTIFRDAQRAAASRWKINTTTLTDAARLTAPYVGKDGKPGSVAYHFCLPPEYAAHNLLPEVREDALRLFAGSWALHHYLAARGLGRTWRSPGPVRMAGWMTRTDC